MDSSLNPENNKSKYITAELKKSKKDDDSIEFKNNSGMLTAEEMDSMASYAISVSKKAIEEILDGYCKPSPYKNGGTLTCDYCEFKNVCGIASKDYSTVREPMLSNADEFYKGGKVWQKK